MAAATVLLFVLRRLTQDLFWSSQVFDTPRLRLTVVLLVLLGVAVGALLMLSESTPLLAAVPAVSLGFAFATVPNLRLTGVGWIPWTITEQIYLSFGPTPYILVGMLASVVAWHFPRSSVEVGRRSPRHVRRGRRAFPTRIEAG